MKHKERQDARKAQAGKNYRDNKLVFADSNGELISLERLLQKRLKPLFERAQLPKEFTLYTLRRTFATLATAAGASRYNQAERLM